MPDVTSLMPSVNLTIAKITIVKAHRKLVTLQIFIRVSVDILTIFSKNNFY